MRVITTPWIRTNNFILSIADAQQLAWQIAVFCTAMRATTKPRITTNYSSDTRSQYSPPMHQNKLAIVIRIDNTISKN